MPAPEPKSKRQKKKKELRRDDDDDVEKEKEKGRENEQPAEVALSTTSHAPGLDQPPAQVNPYHHIHVPLTNTPISRHAHLRASIDILSSHLLEMCPTNNVTNKQTNKQTPSLF